MAFLGLALILGFMYFIEWLEKKGCEKQNIRIEEIQRRAYAWADENLPSPVHAREFKAQVDTMAHSICESKGRAYNPPTLQEVTTEKERKEREACDRKGIRYYSEPVIEDIARRMAYDNNFEFFVQQRMRVFGCSREEAEEVVKRGFEADGLYRPN